MLAAVGLSLVLSLLSFQVQTASLCTATVPAAGGSFTEGLVGRPQYLNPLLSDDNPVDQHIVALVYDGLTSYSPSGDLLPALADSWTVSEDGLSVRFNLDQRARWHDGEPVTAADVAFTYGLLQDEAFPAPSAVRTLWDGVVIRVEDAWTVSFDLPAPYPPFLDATTRGILPAHVLADTTPGAIAAAPFNQSPVGTGPFMVESASWTRTGRLRLLPNPRFWQRGVRLDALELRFYPSDEAAVDALARGELLGLTSVAPTLLPEVARLPDVALYSAPALRMTELIFNLMPDRASPVADLAVRRALVAGLDRDALLDTALNGQGIPLDGPFLPSSWAFRVLTPLTHDPVSATLALEAAGFRLVEGGRGRQDENGQLLSLRLLLLDAEPELALARAIGAQWLELGVAIELAPEPLAGLREGLSEREFDVALITITPGGDPDLYDFWSQEAILRGQNYGGWNNRRASEALEAARQLWSRPDREEQYARFLRLYMADLPAVTLFQAVETYAISTRVNEVDIGRIDHPRDRYSSLADWYYLFREVTVTCPDDSG